MSTDGGPGVAFAIAAHPDDIEFMMSGTLILLARAGWKLHYMNIATGSCGTVTQTRDEIVRVRTEEARSAAAMIGATFHEPIVDDIDIFYQKDQLARIGAIVREVAPNIMLLQSPQDYMEDHMNSSRLAVTAAFCRGMRNFPTDPPVGPTSQDVALYHSLPYGLRDQLRRPIVPDFYVDISDVIVAKRDMLACHRSQKEWLDASQGLDSYLATMESMCEEVGRLSGRFRYAEGWRQHSHLGFGPEDYDPLTAALGDRVAWERQHDPGLRQGGEV